jgi:hypothetical protein
LALERTFDASVQADVVPPQSAPSAVQLDWFSINGGGVTEAGSTNYRVGCSIAQSVAGAAASPSYSVGLGFWYGVGGAAPGTCQVVNTGDINGATGITSSDIIYLVNFVFKGGPAPLPCAAAGDVNCSEHVSSADIIYLVNYVFKAGALPCDVCTLIASGDWTCP